MNRFEQHEANMKALPELCYTVTPMGELVVLKRGVMGHFPAREMPGRSAHDYASHQNAQMGVSAEQERAMVAGSMFGWHLPLAHPDTYVRKVA